MSVLLEDGKGRGNKAAVTRENQLFVQSENHPHQHHESAVNGQVYQVNYFITSGISASATTNVLFIKNLAATRNLCVTYERMKAILAGTLPDAGCYFEIGFGQTYTSGGTELSATQTNRSSANQADILAYGNNPTLGGSFERLDLELIKASGDPIVFNKEGSVILSQNKTMTVRLVTATGHTGSAYARVTFMMIDKDET